MGRAYRTCGLIDVLGNTNLTISLPGRDTVRFNAKPMLLADDLSQIRERWPEISECFQNS
jgi:hypothetical protein